MTSNKKELSELLSINKYALRLCHDAARFDLQKPFEVRKLDASYFTAKRIIKALETPSKYGFEAVVFFTCKFNFSRFYAIHLSALDNDGILSHVFPHRNPYTKIHEFWNQSAMESGRKDLRYYGGDFFVVAQERQYLRPASEFDKRSVNESGCGLYTYEYKHISRAYGYVSGTEDKSGYNSLYAVADRIRRLEEKRAARAKAKADDFDASEFKHTMRCKIQECREMVADYILNYTPVSSEWWRVDDDLKIARSLAWLICNYSEFCRNDINKQFKSVQAKQYAIDKLNSAADEIKAAYTEWESFASA